MYSKKIDRFYIGYTHEIKKRLEYHFNGEWRYTKRATDWDLVYREELLSKKEAIARERYIKKQKSRVFIKNLIGKGDIMGS